MKTNAVTPKELGATAGDDIPEVVIKAVNNLLKKQYRRGRSVTLKQDDIVDEILRLEEDTHRDHIFDYGWLDFEPVFERAGWRVDYDKPAYCESYPAIFKFTPKQ